MCFLPHALLPPSCIVLRQCGSAVRLRASLCLPSKLAAPHSNSHNHLHLHLASLPARLPACSLAISQAIVIGGCTPTLNRVLARAEALAIAQGNGGKFKSVAEATAVAQCLG